MDGNSKSDFTIYSYFTSSFLSLENIDSRTPFSLLDSLDTLSTDFSFSRDGVGGISSLSEIFLFFYSSSYPLVIYSFSSLSSDGIYFLFIRGSSKK